jgi:hypothetical protein
MRQPEGMTRNEKSPEAFALRAFGNFWETDQAPVTRIGMMT